MKFFTKSLQVLFLVTLLQQIGTSQTCPTSSIAVSANTTICSGSCANLTSTVTALEEQQPIRLLQHLYSIPIWSWYNSYSKCG